jgi:hypothetical protein
MEFLAPSTLLFGKYFARNTHAHKEFGSWISLHHCFAIIMQKVMHHALHPMQKVMHHALHPGRGIF